MITTTEHLAAIASKCRDNITIADGMLRLAAGVYAADLKYSIAGWKSTLAAIDGWNDMLNCALDNMEGAGADEFKAWESVVAACIAKLETILAAWPIETLDK